MKIINKYKSLLFILFMGVLVCACDPDGEEIMSWRAGSSLHIIGPDEVTVGATSASYRVDGFTVKETYTWAVNGVPVTPTRNGEFISVAFPDPGTYTITVTNGTYQGTLPVTVVP